MTPLPLYQRPIVIERCMFLERSYERLLDKPLLDPKISGKFRNAADLAHALFFEKSLIIVAHDFQQDPVFWFGNKRALKHWQMTADEFTSLPSRLSAPESEDNSIRDERRRMLAEVNVNGYVTGYSGIRISKYGHRFRIVDATIFNICNFEKMQIGQAAVFSTVEPIAAGALGPR